MDVLLTQLYGMIMVLNMFGIVVAACMVYNMEFKGALMATAGFSIMTNRWASSRLEAELANAMPLKKPATPTIRRDCQNEFFGASQN